jgi:hypothetical protein
VSFDIGDVVTLDFTVAVDGVPTNATVTLTVTQPDGTTLTPAPSISNPTTGSYTASLLAAMNGLYSARWVSTGAATASQTDAFWVGTGISVSDVKLRLNKTLSVDDTEIQSMLDAALAEYGEYVGPVAGPVTETLSGGGTALLLRSPNVTAITAAAYSDGTTITVDDLVVDNGIISWGYNTAGYFTRGIRNVTVTYTVGALSANHREAIIADVAGYFDLTQSGPAGPDDGYSIAQRGAPLILFPRIRALALPGIA